MSCKYELVRRRKPKIDIQGAPKVGSSKVRLLSIKKLEPERSRQVNPNNRLCSVLHAVCLVPVATLCVMLSLMLCCPARALGYTTARVVSWCNESARCAYNLACHEANQQYSQAQHSGVCRGRAGRVHAATVLCPASKQEDKAFLAHFCTVTTVKKTDTNTFCRCMVLRVGPIRISSQLPVSDLSE